MSPERMRLFLAVFPSREAQEAAVGAAARLRTQGDGVSWVRRENLHYTLRFLGDLGAADAKRAGAAAREAAKAHAPFPARLGGFGAFPSAAKARVLWIGLDEGAEALHALARSLDESLERRGFGRADQPFTPHLTIGRVRGGDDFEARLAAAAAAEGAWTVGALRLVKSTLSPHGSRYETMLEAPLGG